MLGNQRAKSRAYEQKSKAVSLDDLAKQREVQVAEHDEAVNSKATREESYHTFFGEVLAA